MDKQTTLAAVIKTDPYLGDMVVPCLCRREQKGFLTVSGRLSAENPETLNMPEHFIVDLHKLSLSLEPANIAGRFSKKTVSKDDFFRNAEKRLTEHVLMPFVWRQTDRLLMLLKKHNINIYDGRDSWPNLYESHLKQVADDVPDTCLHFSRTASGITYTININDENRLLNLQAPGTLLLSLQPCYLMQGSLIWRFPNNISGKLFKPFIKKKEIHIPKHFEKEYFTGFVKKMANRVDVQAEGFDVVDVPVDPGAVLAIEQDIQGKYGFLLRFDYGGRQVIANNNQLTFTALEINENHFVFKRFRRDMVFEEKMARKLLSFDVEQFGAFYRMTIPANNEAGFLDYVVENRYRLEKAGFQIEHTEEERYILEKPRVVLNNHHYSDWFDLNIVIHIGDAEIAFKDLKDHIINEERWYVLPTGERFLIPEEWFERYKGLVFHGRDHKGSWRVPKHHFPVLEDFDLPEVKRMRHIMDEETAFAAPKVNDVTLRPYQVTGYSWLQKLAREGFGGILADDMGLGKTLQVIAMLSSVYSPNQQHKTLHEPRKAAKSDVKAGVQLGLFDEPDSISGQTYPESEKKSEEPPDSRKQPSLIVVPASVLHNWLNELKRFAPWLHVCTYAGAERSLASSLSGHLMLTTYGTLRNDVESLKEILFTCIILDESQNIRNQNSKTARAAFALKGLHKFALTGTPVENKLSDIWSQMHFVNPGLLGSIRSFQQQYGLALEHDPSAPEAIQLWKLLRPFILRRTKDQVARELPALTESVIYCEMTDEQGSVYEREKSRFRNHLLQGISDMDILKTRQIMLLKALTKLRQIANHPRLVDINLDMQSGKFRAITENLETLLEENHKVLVFSSFVTHLELLETWLKKAGVKYAKLTGSTVKREEVIKMFKKDDVPVFLISLKAGGVGLNLTEASYVFMLDPWWNPAAEMQAIHRAHRIGQDKKVFVYRFISKDTVEEKIIRLQNKKARLAENLIRKESFVAGMTAEELSELLQ
ncbi:MAG: DEAD/DEAH box helicase [Bacteroidia bacterium]|nr:MAG: DEAD/DEAH box helicase [Bacteroidia bacterium]